MTRAVRYHNVVRFETVDERDGLRCDDDLYMVGGTMDQAGYNFDIELI